MMRLSLIASLLAVEQCFVFYVELKELCDMIKLLGSPFKVFVEPGTLQFESPDSFQGLSLNG